MCASSGSGADLPESDERRAVPDLNPGHSGPGPLVDAIEASGLVDPDSTGVLLLSGGADPVTPARDGRRAAKGLPHSLQVVLEGMGHGQIGAPCVDRLVADFLSAGTTTGLDVACVERVRPMPFFTTLAGPPP